MGCFKFKYLNIILLQFIMMTMLDLVNQNDVQTQTLD